MKSFRPKNASGEGPGSGPGEPPPGRNREIDFRKTKRSNATHASTTDKDARLYRKGAGQESCLAYLGHTLMENRNGLVAAAEATLASGTGECEAAAAFSQRLPKGATLGADKGYDAEAFVEGLKARGIAPHIAINGTVSKNARGCAYRFGDLRAAEIDLGCGGGVSFLKVVKQSTKRGRGNGGSIHALSCAGILDCSADVRLRAC